VQLTRRFFAVLGDDFSGYVVCRTATDTKGGLRLDGRFRLSYGTALQDLRTLLRHLGYEPGIFAEHSARRGAATDSSAAGLTSNDLQKIVGWRSASMPAVYTDWCPEMFLKCSDKLQNC
jgi:hypothetical protein